MGRVLVADVGGTNTRFARFGDAGLEGEERWPTRDVLTLKDGVARYLSASRSGGRFLRRGRRARLRPRGAVDQHTMDGAGGGSSRPGSFRQRSGGRSRSGVLGEADRVVIRAAELEPRAPRVVLGLGTGLEEAIAVSRTVLPGEAQDVRAGG